MIQTEEEELRTNNIIKEAAEMLLAITRREGEMTVGVRRARAMQCARECGLREDDLTSEVVDSIIEKAKGG